MTVVRRRLIGVVAGVVALEVALQVAALLAPLIARSPETAGTLGAARILVVGDSHAAGAGVPAGERLSDHLERMLSARHPGRVFEVMNVGRAGVNSAYVANRLEGNILAYRPHVVVVWVGVNDIWNTLETESWAIGDWRLRLQRSMLRSKVYRLLVVLWHTRSRDDERAPKRWPFSGEELARAMKGLAFDLERMARSAFTLGTPILFVNYPVPYEGVNPTIQASGARLAVPVVKTEDDLWRAKGDGHDRGLLTFGAGPHPTGLLYRYVAESTVPHVEMLLRQVGVDVRRPPPG